MIIGINGKIGSGKDTVGSIIQYLTSECGDSNSPRHRTYTEFLQKGGGSNLRNFDQHYVSDWEIKKFAGKLKQIASLLTGVDVEKFEDQEFKQQYMSEEWNNPNPVIYENGNKAWMPMTYREFLQRLGTEAMRDGLHTNVWVNALFADYKKDIVYYPLTEEQIEYNSKQNGPVPSVNQKLDYPNWIITDMRFPNEMEAVELREGVTIKVVRYKVGNKVYWTDPEGVSSGSYEISEVYQDFCCIYNDFSEAEVPYHEVKHKSENLHASETALDDAHFDHVISNNGTIDELVERVKEILTIEEIL
jgi:hypothetical protein